MRERTKWNIQLLTQQVEQLTHALETTTQQKNDLYNRFLTVSEENDHLRVQKAALQLRLLGNGRSSSENEASPIVTIALHEAIPLNTSPTTMSDQILQTFVESRWEAYAFQTAGRIESYPEKPDLSALFDGRPNRNVDETSAVVGDIVRSFKEIDTLPKQVAVHYVMSTLMRWQVLRTPASFDAMPVWLRPEKAQLERAHPSWIDRIPW
jgi:regulator of replication initiation timing